MPAYRHYGLYFTSDHIQQARQNRARKPLHTAWEFLGNHQPDDRLAAAQLGALRYRFLEDTEAGAEGVQALLPVDRRHDDHWRALTDTLVVAHTFEMLRDHPVMPVEQQTPWLSDFADGVTALNQPAYELAYHQTLWLGALNLAAGVVLENDELFGRGVECYRRAVNDDIRPEGYIPKAVELGDGRGMVLMAEAAGHVGVDLWNYASRGVSVKTACAYLVYYYYYPDKWRWDEGFPQDSNSLYKTYGGFWEMVYRRDRSKNMQLMLDGLRPLYDPPGGGLTTLTHGGVTRRGLFR
jgi:hypothetical protein